jgi:hypothetical protein
VHSRSARLEFQPQTSQDLLWALACPSAIHGMAKKVTRDIRRNLGFDECVVSKINMETNMGRGILLWLLGVPIPVIILLWLFFGH